MAVNTPKLSTRTDCKSEDKVFPITYSLGHEINLFLHDVVTFQPECTGTATALGRDADLERALVLARANDLVCVSAEPQPAQIKFLAELGLGPCRDNIICLNERTPSERGISHAGALLEDPMQLDAICSKLPPDTGVVINPFIVTPECLKLASVLQERLARDIVVSGGKTEIVNTCIQKHMVLEKARHLGVPVPRGEVVTLDRTDDTSPVSLAPLREAVNRQLTVGGAVIIKSAVAVLASKIITIRAGIRNIDEALRRFGPDLKDSVYLVEILYNVTVSPNIVFCIGAGANHVRCVGITDQRLSPDLAHQGNIFPSRAVTLAAMLNAARSLSEWLQSEGFRGIVGYDFCEYIDRATGKPSFFLTEINPRINGSVYPLFIQAQLVQAYGQPIDAFLSVKWFRVNTCVFSEFENKFKHLFFNPEKQAGLVPYNTSGIERGLVDLMFIGRTPEEADMFYAAARRAAGV
jgi:hypothetical protein